MQVTLECYGLLTEICGGLCEISLAGENARVRDVLEALCQQYPAVRPHIAQVACADGDEIVGRDSPVRPGARLALLPPVSGG